MTQICLAVLDPAKFQNIVEGVHSVQVGWVLVETSELFVVFSKCPKNTQKIIQPTKRKKKIVLQFNTHKIKCIRKVRF